MVFLPEACDYVESSTAATLAKCEPLDGQFIANYRQLAAECAVWISIGSFHRKVVIVLMIYPYTQNLLIKSFHCDFFLEGRQKLVDENVQLARGDRRQRRHTMRQ